MSSITTTSNPENRYVWIQTDEDDSTQFICEPHTKIIDDLKRMVFGDKRTKYKAFHRQQYLRPGLPIPVDSTDVDPIHFKRIENRRCEFFFKINQQMNHAFFFIFSATQSPTDDSNSGGIIRAGPSATSGTQNMASSQKVTTSCNRWMNQLQSNCT